MASKTYKACLKGNHAPRTIKGVTKVKCGSTYVWLHTSDGLAAVLPTAELTALIADDSEPDPEPPRPPPQLGS